MDERALTETLLWDHFTVAGALADLQLDHLSDEARCRVFDAVRNGTGHVELRTRIDAASSQVASSSK
jgi:hypothetical protein